MDRGLDLVERRRVKSRARRTTSQVMLQSEGAWLTLKLDIGSEAEVDVVKIHEADAARDVGTFGRGFMGRGQNQID